MTVDDRPTLLHLTTADVSLALLLGPQLAAFRDAGYRVIGASAPGPYLDRIEELGVEFIPVEHATRSMAPGHDALALIELVRLFRRVRPDIVHTHNPKPGLYGRLAARAARVPVVVNTIHGLYALPEDRAAKRRLVYGLERLAATCSDAELVQNPEDVETLHRIGIPDRKVQLLGNGIDLSRYQTPPAASRDQLRRDLGLEPDRPVVGTVGRLVWEKGLRELFDAARSLRTTHPEAQVVVVGPIDPEKSDGLAPADLEQICRETGVIFAGERRDMALVYPAFDLFVLASHREGFPRAAMEASASGLPVVATNIRGCRQVVDDEETGLLVPVRDARALDGAITRLLDDPEERAAMGRAGAQRAIEHFDQQRVIDITLATYAELLAR